MKPHPPLFGVLTLVLLTAWTFNPSDPHSDRDGRPAVHQLHKHLTDPKKRDTASDGVADGDWDRRREFNYSVRAVLRVMRPVNLKMLNDDYQDARVRAETKDYV